MEGVAKNCHLNRTTDQESWMCIGSSIERTLWYIIEDFYYGLCPLAQFHLAYPALHICLHFLYKMGVPVHSRELIALLWNIPFLLRQFRPAEDLNSAAFSLYAMDIKEACALLQLV